MHYYMFFIVVSFEEGWNGVFHQLYLMMSYESFMLQRPEDLWAIHSQPVFPRPHKKDNPSWIAIQKVPIYVFHFICHDIYTNNYNSIP